jgi:hypothetical protein
MRSFLILIVLIGALAAIDAIAYGGRYRTAVWQEANYQGQMVRYGIQNWLKGLGL